MGKFLLSFAIVFFLTTACAPRRAQAQFQGFVGLQTVQQTLATNVACTGSNQFFTVNNLGQTQHFLTVVAPGAIPVSFDAVLQGVDRSGNATQISDDLKLITGTTTTGSVTASGYFPSVQAMVNCTSGNFTLNYSGTSVTPNPLSGGYQVAQIEKIIVNGASAGLSSGADFHQTPFGNSLGSLVFQTLGGAPAGSTLTFACINATNATIRTMTFALTTATGVQLFGLPAGPCTTAKVTYTSGGASGSTYFLEVLYALPGTPSASIGAAALAAPFNSGANIVEKGPRWQVNNAPAVGAQATASRAAGAAAVRHVADCVTVSAGAAVAPVATNMTINLRDGASGAGTILWTTTITAAATAAQHGNVSFCGLNLIGTAATAMTIEFSALLASEQQSVFLSGYDVQ